VFMTISVVFGATQGTTSYVMSFGKTVSGVTRLCVVPSHRLCAVLVAALLGIGGRLRSSRARRLHTTWKFDILFGMYSPRQVNEQFPNRSSRRAMHGSIQLISAGFGALGVLTVIGMHTTMGRSNLGGDDVSQAYKVHVWLGYSSIVLVMAQVT
jgi:hypothetical protein